MSEETTIDLNGYTVVKRSAFAFPRERMTFEFEQNGRIIFSKECLDAIGDPEYVVILISTKEKFLILSRWIKIEPRDHRPKGYRVVRDAGRAFVLENCSCFLDKVTELMGWASGSVSQMVFFGNELGNGMMEFDLKDAFVIAADPVSKLVNRDARKAAAARRKGLIMVSFKGFEVVPAAGMFSTGVKQIRITVSSKKVGLSEQLLDALDHPAFVTFHRGVGENEGKMIIAVTEGSGEEGEIQLDPGRKYAAFYNCDFVRMCDEMIRIYANGSFKRGTYFSIAGTKMDEDGAVIFDFRKAEEHCVRVSKGSIAAQRANQGFPMPQRVYSMPERPRSQG